MQEIHLGRGGFEGYANMCCDVRVTLGLGLVKPYIKTMTRDGEWGSVCVTVYVNLDHDIRY